jgi:hypothetical protein
MPAAAMRRRGVAGVGAIGAQLARQDVETAISRDWRGLGAHQFVPFTLPSPNNPNWTPVPAWKMANLKNMAGWSGALATAQMHGQSIFPFRHGWYMLRGTQIWILGPGSRPLKSTGIKAGAGDAGVGQTKSNFQPPTEVQIQANFPGDTLTHAAENLINTFQASGVPSEHAFSGVTSDFQTAWNADPVSDSNGANSKLSVDGGYGPNTHDALDSIASDLGLPPAPAVNTGAAPGPAPGPPPPPPPPPGPKPAPPAPPVTPSSNTGGYLIAAGGILVAAGLVGWAVWSQKQSEEHHGSMMRPARGREDHMHY